MSAEPERVCTCGSKSLLRVGPAFPPSNWKEISWGCTPTGAFRCPTCGIVRKYHLREGEPRDRDLVSNLEA